MGLFEDYFSGKTFVIAGMGIGQGLSSARLLCSMKSRVYGLSRSGKFPSEKGDDSIRVLKCDLEGETEVKDTLKTIFEKEGQINGVLNNVGTWEFSEKSMVEPDILFRFLSSNVLTQYNVIYGASTLLEPGSSIVNIGASRNLFRGNNSGYTISKSAIEEMTRTAASSLKASGIRVNAVLPGSVGKEDNFGNIFPFNFKNKGAMDPLKIAYVTAFLLSPLSSGINGVSIPADDGMGL
ncbi:MAG: SDR family oxidoreductase [Cuniculiplasma sp.]